MAASVYSSPGSRLRNNKSKAKTKVITIVSAQYVIDFIISLTFNTGETKTVDFLPLFHKYLKGSNLKYFTLQNFKKFIIRDGNISWGKNEDVIFTIDLLYDFDSKQEDKVLSIIK
jgi:hypothetical protein